MSGCKVANLADYKSETVRRWVETSPTTHRHMNNNLETTPKSIKGQLNNNTIDFLAQSFWQRQTKEGIALEDMPMLLQQPNPHLALAGHHHHPHHQKTGGAPPGEKDQPLDFTMSKFKTKAGGAATVASQLKQLNSLGGLTSLQNLNSLAAAQQQMLLLQSNGVYFNSAGVGGGNNNKFAQQTSPTIQAARVHSPGSASSGEAGVGPPNSSPRSNPASPGPLRDGKHQNNLPVFIIPTGFIQI